MAFVNTIKGYFYVAFGGGFSRGVALLNTMIIARMLGPSFFGAFSIFYTIMILTWQLPGAFDAIFVAYGKQVDTKQEKNELLKTSVVLKLFYFFVIIVLSYPVGHFLSVYCFKKAEVLIPIMLAMLCGGSLMFLMTIASIFQEEESFARYAAIPAFYTVSILIFLVVGFAARLEFTLMRVIGVYVTISLMIGTVCIAIIWRRVGSLLNFTKALLMKAFSQGKWVFVSVASESVFVRIDILFLTRYVDFESLGIYSVAATLIQVVYLATGALAGICLPKAAAAIRSKQAFKGFFRESILIIGLIVAGILVFMLLAPYAITILYGHEYAAATKVLRILLVGWIFNVFFIPFSFMFLALGDSQTRFYIEFFKLLLGISLLALIVPRYGVVGAAYAIALAHIISSVIANVILKFKISNLFKQAEYERTIKREKLAEL